MAPGMGGPVGVGGDGRHDDEAVLTEFLSSLMDYTPTVWQLILSFSEQFGSCYWNAGLTSSWFGGATDPRRAGGALPRPQRLQLPRPPPVSAGS